MVQLYEKTTSFLHRTSPIQPNFMQKSPMHQQSAFFKSLRIQNKMMIKPLTVVGGGDQTSFYVQQRSKKINKQMLTKKTAFTSEPPKKIM
jgi:carbonic anhydrase/acetyltransferase-like protein (isoleucine patch superfamily)